MEITYMNEFLQLVDFGSYQEAANKLFISQSSLSKHIKAMENELGVNLFKRGSRQVKLTDQGKAFLPYARKITAMQSEYLQMFKQFGFRVLVGTFPMISQYGITTLLALISQNHPRLSIDLRRGSTDELVMMLYRGECDLVFVREESVRMENVVKTLITEDHLVTVVPLDHPLTARDRISMDELKNEKLLLPVKGTNSYNMFLNFCHQAGFDPKVAFSYMNDLSAIDLVSHHIGIAVLMRKSCEYIDLKKYGVRILEVEPTLTTRICLACKSKSSLSPAAQIFLDAVHELGYCEEYE